MWSLLFVVAVVVAAAAAHTRTNTCAAKSLEIGAFWNWSGLFWGLSFCLFYYYYYYLAFLHYFHFLFGLTFAPTYTQTGGRLTDTDTDTRTHTQRARRGRQRRCFFRLPLFYIFVFLASLCFTFKTNAASASASIRKNGKSYRCCCCCYSCCRVFSPPREDTTLPLNFRKQNERKTCKRALRQRLMFSRCLCRRRCSLYALALSLSLS